MTDTSLRIPGNALGAPTAPPLRTRPRGPWSVRRVAGSVSAAEVGRAVWRAVWIAFWFGSDVPAPHLPSRDLRVPAGIGLAGEQVVRTLDRIRRRIWLTWVLNVLVRGAWLGGLIGVVWLLLEQLGGPAFDGEVLLRTSLGVFALGAVFAALIRPSRRRTARMLDRSFRLHERMTTALENLGHGVPSPGVRAQVVYLQMADAANVVADLRRHPAFRLRLPLRELVLALACALLLAALFFLRGVGGGIPEVVSAGVPAFTPAANRARVEEPAPNPGAVPPGAEQAPTTAEVQERAARSNEAQRDLAALGRALDDHPATRPTADAIARGDYDQAADALRDLAGRADQLSDEAREALADDLDVAAGEMSEGSNELAQATRDAASGLREGGEPAQQGVQNLGDAVQQTGEEVVSQQELAGQMAAARAAEQSGTQGEAGEQSQGGEQQAGEPGASGESGQEQGASGDQSAGSQGQPGEAGQQGSDGQTGESGQRGSQSAADRGNNPGQSQNQGQGEQRGRTGRSASQPGQAGMPQAGNPQAGDPGSPFDEAGQPGQSGAESTGNPQAGDGAGSGDAQSQGAEQEGAGSTGEDPSAAQGLPAEERVTTAQPPEGGEGAGDPRSANDAITLDRTGGPGVQTGNDSGSASPGSGTGVTTASGETEQREVGEAGPDSNRVPPEYRDLVQDYFSDSGQSR